MGMRFTTSHVGTVLISYWQKGSDQAVQKSHKVINDDPADYTVVYIVLSILAVVVLVPSLTWWMRIRRGLSSASRHLILHIANQARPYDSRLLELRDTDALPKLQKYGKEPSANQIYVKVQAAECYRYLRRLDTNNIVKEYFIVDCDIPQERLIYEFQKCDLVRNEITVAVQLIDGVAVDKAVTLELLVQQSMSNANDLKKTENNLLSTLQHIPQLQKSFEKEIQKMNLYENKITEYHSKLQQKIRYELESKRDQFEKPSSTRDSDRLQKEEIQRDVTIQQQQDKISKTPLILEEDGVVDNDALAEQWGTREHRQYFVSTRVQSPDHIKQVVQTVFSNPSSFPFNYITSKLKELESEQQNPPIEIPKEFGYQSELKRRQKMLSDGVEKQSNSPPSQVSPLRQIDMPGYAPLSELVSGFGQVDEAQPIMMHSQQGVENKLQDINENSTDMPFFAPPDFTDIVPSSHVTIEYSVKRTTRTNSLALNQQHQNSVVLDNLIVGDLNGQQGDLKLQDSNFIKEHNMYKMNVRSAHLSTDTPQEDAFKFMQISSKNLPQAALVRQREHESITDKLPLLFLNEKEQYDDVEFHRPSHDEQFVKPMEITRNSFIDLPVFQGLVEHGESQELSQSNNKHPSSILKSNKSSHEHVSEIGAHSSMPELPILTNNQIYQTENFEFPQDFPIPTEQQFLNQLNTSPNEQKLLPTMDNNENFEQQVKILESSSATDADLPAFQLNPSQQQNTQNTSVNSEFGLPTFDQGRNATDEVSIQPKKSLLNISQEAKEQELPMFDRGSVDIAMAFDIQGSNQRSEAPRQALADFMEEQSVTVIIKRKTLFEDNNDGFNIINSRKLSVAERFAISERFRLELALAVIRREPCLVIEQDGKLRLVDAVKPQLEPQPPMIHNWEEYDSGRLLVLQIGLRIAQAVFLVDFSAVSDLISYAIQHQSRTAEYILALMTQPGVEELWRAVDED